MEEQRREKTVREKPQILSTQVTFFTGELEDQLLALHTTSNAGDIELSLASERPWVQTPVQKTLPASRWKQQGKFNDPWWHSKVECRVGY